MKHFINLCFSILACMAFSACSSDDPIDDTPHRPDQPAQHSDDTWEVEIEGDMTRGLSYDGTTASITFATTETIYVKYGSESVGELHPAANSQTTKLSGRLNNKNYTAGQKLTLYYYGPGKTSAPTYTSQAGTTTYIQNNYAYSKAEATINNVDTENHKLTLSKADFVAQQAIIGFKFNEDLVSGEVITIKKTNASGDVLAKVSSSPEVAKNSTVVYVALPLTNSPTNYTLYFDITKSSKPHAIGTLALTADNRKMQNGQYYSTQTVSLTHHMSYATAADVKAHKGINSSGYIVNLTSSCVAMIAYVSGSTRIALSKKDAPDQGTRNTYYTDANSTKVNTIYQNTVPKTLPDGTSGWKIPSITEWEYVLQGVTKATNYVALTTSTNNNFVNVDPDENNTNTSVVDKLDKMYWSSTRNGTSKKNWTYRAPLGTKKDQGYENSGTYGENDYFRAIFTINPHP